MIMSKRTELQQVKEEVSQLKEDLNKLKVALTGVKPKTEIEQLKEEVHIIKQNLRDLDTVPRPKSKAQELTEQRVRFNNAILGKISAYLEKNPDIRFGQALQNLKIVDIQGISFYEEPFDTYMRILIKEK